MTPTAAVTSPPAVTARTLPAERVLTGPEWRRHDAWSTIAGATKARCGELERTLEGLVGRDRGPRGTVDGFGSGRGGGGSGPGDRTAGAGLARARDDKRGGDYDEVHRLRERAEGLLLTISTQLVELADILDRQVPGAVGGSQITVSFCEACEPAADVEASARHPWDRYVRDGKGLPRPMHLCESARQFAAKRDRLPTREEAAYHARTGLWKVRLRPGERP